MQNTFDVRITTILYVSLATTKTTEGGKHFCVRHIFNRPSSASRNTALILPLVSRKCNHTITNTKNNNYPSYPSNPRTLATLANLANLVSGIRTMTLHLNPWDKASLGPQNNYYLTLTYQNTILIVEAVIEWHTIQPVTRFMLSMPSVVSDAQQFDLVDNMFLFLLIFGRQSLKLLGQKPIHKNKRGNTHHAMHNSLYGNNKARP